MEQSQKFSFKLSNFKNALNDFKDLMEINLEDFSGKILDGLKNGQIQKFECVTEATWKIIKAFLLIKHGIEVKTPKQSIKEFYNNKFIDEELYLCLIEMIDNRNLLSHIYEKETFEEIHSKLYKYLEVLNNILVIVEND